LRQQDDRLRAAPLLGRPLASLSHLDAAFVIGSQLRHDHPLLALRLRASARHGAQISRLHAVADDWAMPIAQSLTAAPSRWLEQLAGVAAAVAALKGALPSPAEYFETMKAKVLPAAEELYAPLDFAGTKDFTLGYAGDR